SFRLGAIGLAFALTLAPRLGQAEQPPLPFGPPPYDEVRRAGREVAPARARPEASEAPSVACSFREQVCLHAPPAARPDAALWTLHPAARALRGFRAVGLPGPLPDGALGGGSAFDIYLLPDAAAPVTTVDLVAQGGGLDRQSAFTVMPPPPLPTACDA